MRITERPFPHAVIDGQWDPALLRSVVEEFPPSLSPAWGTFDNEHERKQACADPAFYGPATQSLIDQLCDAEMCAELSESFDIPALTASTVGGGYHQILDGGFLDVHVDFNRGEGLYRRLNQLVYLNEGYEELWGGQLILDGDPRMTIEPRFNRTVVFATSDVSWHGHPNPWSGIRPRRSIAVYYFSPEPADASDSHSTLWRAV